MWSGCAAGVGHAQESDECVLMDDIPWVTQKVLSMVSQVSMTTEEVWMGRHGEALISLADFAEGKVLVWFDAPQSTDWTPHVALVLKVMQNMAIAEHDGISGDHWLRQLAPSVNDLRPTWTPHGAHGEAQFWGDMGCYVLSLCEQVDIEVTSTTDLNYRLSTVGKDDRRLAPKGDTVTPQEDDEDVHCGEMDLQCYVIDHGNASDHSVDAIAEGDVYCEEWREESAKDWLQKVRALKGVRLCQMAQTVMSGELNNLDLKQDQQMALIRRVQRRRGNGEMYNTQPHVIDLMDAEFWTQLAKAMEAIEQDANDDRLNMADRLRVAFTSGMQPGCQQPATVQQDEASKA